jgi:DNA-binding winged helix-turn-helix (wHTH) protein/tetratricopeptide (TPR) repeat protein/TolB-like protein
MSASTKSTFSFREFELDPVERRLLRAGESIALTPKVFDTLVFLVERAGRLVSKEELIQGVWPRGFVDESNLTKHIWLIRRALGENDQGAEFIETVPKVGYRFVAPVIRGVEGASMPQIPQALASGGRTERYRWSVGFALTALVAIVLIAGWRFWPHRPANRVGAVRTVAVLGFSNLSGNAKDAWIGPALTEMLSAELNAMPNVRLVPEELLPADREQPGAPPSVGYSAAKLEALSRRLKADYLMSGGYSVTGAEEDAPLRIEIALQDVRSGKHFEVPIRNSRVSGLMSLSSDAGRDLRKALGGPVPAERLLEMVSSAQPPSVGVARRIGFALDALHDYDAARARDELLQAIAEAPGYGLSYVYLSQAWAALGYHEKARAAAEQAARHSEHFSPEQRLQADAMVAASRSEWPRAAQLYQSLSELKPEEPDYRLKRIEAQIAGGMGKQAETTLAELRRLQGMDTDPRVELAAARIARSLDNARAQAEHAQLAVEQAKQRDATGLLADAQVALGNAQQLLGQLAEARATLELGVSNYRAMQNPRGEINVRRALGRIAFAEHNTAEAREEYQRAMALAQGIGDEVSMAGIYTQISEVLWNAGDRDGAQAAARQSLRLAQSTADLKLQAWSLRALATIASDEAASDEVISDYREVLAIQEKTDDRGGQVWSLATIADVERLRGSLKEAQESCSRAKREVARLSDPQFAIYTGFTCALVDIDQGKSAEGRAALLDVISRATDAKDPVYATDARMMLAQLDMDDAQWSTARALLVEASRDFAANELPTGEADATAMLALCAQAQGDSAGRDQATARARKLRDSITSKQEVFFVDIALAEVAARQSGAGAAPLLELADDAERRHFIAWAAEARLAALQVMQAQHEAGVSAHALRVKLENDAQRGGFGRVLRRLHTLEASDPPKT